MTIMLYFYGVLWYLSSVAIFITITMNTTHAPCALVLRPIIPFRDINHTTLQTIDSLIVRLLSGSPTVQGDELHLLRAKESPPLLVLLISHI